MERMPTTIRVYLAGKVGTAKWNMVEGVEGAEFVASDCDKHSEHGWGYGSWSFSDPNLRVQLEGSFLSVIPGCTCLIAFLTDATCFGGIAEIAYASAIGIKCYMILTTGMESVELPGEPGHDEIERAYPTPMKDAYWFVSNFPNVRAFEVTTEQEARQITQAIVEAHRAPEYSGALGPLTKLGIHQPR